MLGIEEWGRVVSVWRSLTIPDCSLWVVWVYWVNISRVKRRKKEKE
jgi:hypothetical protein